MDVADTQPLNISAKKILVLEENQYQSQAAISDLAGCDIEAHKGDYEIAMRKVRNWFSSETQKDIVAASQIFGAYLEFQEWHYEKQRNAGFSDGDIQDYPTNELMSAMNNWLKEKC